MIRTDSELAGEQDQLGRAERALESLRERVFPKNPRNFAIFSEAYVDQIDILKAEIDAYAARKKYNTPGKFSVQAVPGEGRAAMSAIADGLAALIAGETGRAAECFGRAGKSIEASIGSKWKQSDKHHLRLRAAAQYFLGGHYNKVDSLCKKIQADLLPSDARLSLDNLRKEAQRRSALDYKTLAEQRLYRCFARSEFVQIIEILREDPYILHQAHLAYLRGLCCVHIGDYRAAAVLFADSWRLARVPPENPKIVLATTGVAFLPIHRGLLAEAAQCVHYQLKHIPHAVTFINGSLLRYYQAMKTNSERERVELSEEQIEFCEEALKRYQELPTAVRDDENMRLLMTHCLQSAAFGAGNIEKRLAFTFCNLAIDFNPTFWGPWTTRGIVTYPDGTAAADFRKAVELGDISWYPNYYLALDSLKHEQYKDTITWSEKALERNPSSLARAQMLTAIGIARASLGSTANEIRSLFEEAYELAPTDSFVAENWRAFRMALAQPEIAYVFERNIKPLETRSEYLDRQFSFMKQKRANQTELRTSGTSADIRDLHGLLQEPWSVRLDSKKANPPQLSVVSAAV